MSGWIGVDLDGTLAVYDKWRGPMHIGVPIPAMVERVKQWLKDGWTVKIFTARISHDNTESRLQEASMARSAIQQWCKEVIGQVLPVTNEKDYGMIECWDDRAVQVVPNTGERVDGKR